MFPCLVPSVAVTVEGQVYQRGGWGQGLAGSWGRYVCIICLFLLLVLFPPSSPFLIITAVTALLSGLSRLVSGKQIGYFLVMKLSQYGLGIGIRVLEISV